MIGAVHRFRAYVNARARLYLCPKCRTGYSVFHHDWLASSRLIAAQKDEIAELRRRLMAILGIAEAATKPNPAPTADSIQFTHGRKEDR